MMAILNGIYKNDGETYQSFQHGGTHVDHIYDSFVCPLSKEIMKNPVTLETGETYEREAIEKWFLECTKMGKKPICPMTLKELKNTELQPSIALKKAIEEWEARNEMVQLDMANKYLDSSQKSSEEDIITSLKDVQSMCKKSRTHMYAILNSGLVSKIVGMLRNRSQKVRSQAVDTLRIMAEHDNDIKETIAKGKTIRTIVKFLSSEHPTEREEAVSLLYEFSRSESLCAKISEVNGAILILIGITSNKSEMISTVTKAERTLENLEKCEKIVRQMAENGRLQPLLTLLLQGSMDTKLSMASYIGELSISNDLKVQVANTIGTTLVDILKSSSIEARKSALKALNSISSSESSANVLIKAGILPPLVEDLFRIDANQLPVKLKEMCASILANLLNLGSNFDSIIVGPNQRTLASEDTIHDLLQLIRNTGPSMECQLLNVLVGLTGSPLVVKNVVSAIQSSVTTAGLIQFIETSHRDLRVASLKFLHHLSPHMGQELADTFLANIDHFYGLVKIITEEGTITEEQVAGVGLLAELPRRHLGITQLLMKLGGFELIVNQIDRIRNGETRGNRYVKPYLEGLVCVLARLSFILSETQAIILAQTYGLAPLFTELLQSNGLDKMQCVSAMALENLAHKSQHLTVRPEVSDSGFCGLIFPFLTQKSELEGLCRVHKGMCSLRTSFCLLEGRALEKLVACLDHSNENVVEAALAALCTLLDDDIDLQQGVSALAEAEAIKPILNILIEHKTPVLLQRAVWAVERMLRTEVVENEISENPSVGTALIYAFQNGDIQTRQNGERALKYLDKIAVFSDILSMVG